MSTLVLLTLLACTGSSPDDTGVAAGDDTADTQPAGPGTLAMSFQMEADLIVSMDVPPVGTFYGSIYAEDDATSMGPVDGATSLEDFSADLDLSDDGGPSDVAYTTGPLDAGVVWVLGCLDVDANDCEEGDPITIPNEDKVIVAADTETPFTVVMNMLRP